MASAAYPFAPARSSIQYNEARGEKVIRPTLVGNRLTTRKALPLNSLDGIIATYISGKTPTASGYGQLTDTEIMEGIPLKISHEQYVTAPVLVWLDFERLQGGKKHEFEKICLNKDQYKGDLHMPSEIGLATFDLRSILEPVVTSTGGAIQTYRHNKPPGVCGEDWIQGHVEFKHFVVLEGLADSFNGQANISPKLQQKITATENPGEFAFGVSQYIRARDVAAQLETELMPFVDQDAPRAPRRIFIISHAHQMETAIMDAYGLDKKLDVCGGTVRMVDMQDSTLWPRTNGGLINGMALAKSLGVADAEIKAHNGGNDTALSALGFFRAVLSTTEEWGRYRQGQPFREYSYFGAKFLRDNINENRKLCDEKREEAKKMRAYYHHHDLESAEIATGLRGGDDRTLLVSSDGTFVQKNPKTFVLRTQAEKTPAQRTFRMYGTHQEEDSYEQHTPAGKFGGGHFGGGPAGKFGGGQFGGGQAGSGQFGGGMAGWD